MNYDSRIFTFIEEDWTVTLTMLKRRERFKLLIGNYQRSLLKGHSPKAAVLVKRQDGSYYLQIQTGSESPPMHASDDVLGIDLGRTDIAVTSNGEKFSGKQVTQIRDKYSTISYRLIQQAKKSKVAIFLEDLTGIRERTNELPRTKTERRRSNSWAFFQLRMFLLYKGIKFGVKVHLVDPRYTSQTCHVCNVLGERKGKKFSCLNLACGWIGDADENGAKNIAKLGQTIILPGGPSPLFCSWHIVLRATENATQEP